jgi:phosphate starvation-inducible PhoH-like protein
MPKKKIQKQKRTLLKFDDSRILRNLFGPEDRYIRRIEKTLNICIGARGNEISLSGDPSSVAVAEQALKQLYSLLKRGNILIDADVEQALKLISHDREVELESHFLSNIVIPTKKNPIIPRSPGQKEYLQEIKDNDIVLAIGPAGTGKTYLACAMAVHLLLKKEFRRIILARPAVEAGERLGFLPGDMVEKVNPYLRPLYDALYDMLDVERVQEMIDEDIIEIAPIAFMRGRTLHGSFVIIDEAQNTNYQQMKMCLTRLGVNSKMVVTGDVTQVDLPETTKSGMLEAWRILKGMRGIAFHEFTEVDIVRHPLVSKIVRAYEKHEKSQ